jgi:exosortase
MAGAWRSLPSKGLLLALSGAWIALFHYLGNSTFGYIDSPSLFGWLNYSYSQSHDDELGRYVPLIVLGLCWWKRDELLGVRKRPSTGALAIVALALLLHVVGFAVQQTRLSVVAFWLGIFGLLGVVWGWAFLRAVFFPFFLVGFAVPIGTMAETITFPLRMLATDITAAISQVGLGVSLIQNGTQIFDSAGKFQYEVAAACGGLRSLTATLALAAIYSFLTLDRTWKRLVMIASAFPLAVAGNVLRLTLIILAAEAFGQKAGNWVHDDPVMSLLPYVPAFLGLRVLGSWLAPNARDEASREPPPAHRPQALPLPE